MKKTLLIPAIVLLLAASLFGRGVTEEPASGDPVRLRMATTTSTENSGLLAELLPPFEEANNVVVDVIAVGTGQALELGRNGDVDVVMVHAPSLEEEFVAQGYGVERVGFMYNDFVVLGPPSDPAEISGSGDVVSAFQRIAESESLFISRGDNSGTHNKELNIWDEAGIAPSGAWYREAGQGMGAVITVSDNEEAYTLADRGTYLSYLGDIDLDVVVEGDPVLFNPYAAIVVDPELHPHVDHETAQAFIDFLVSDEGQSIIGSFTIGGEPLFTPDA
ncbi:MAG: substrate-binding domain-containing protein [Spirochaetota bacterium]